MSTSNIQHSRTATAFFDTRAAAEKAKADLIAHGVASGQIDIASSSAGTPEQSFGERAAIAYEDRPAYAEGLRRGGFLLSVRTDESQYDRVLEILDTDAAVDMDQRETAWQADGWSRSAGEVTSVATGPSDQPVYDNASAKGSPAGWERGTGQVTSVATDPADVPVYDRNMSRRDLSHGRQRVRSYVRGGLVAQNGGAGHISAHMDVLGSGGEMIGTVDHMEGNDKIKLAKSTSPDGQHHYIPLSWVDRVDSHVHLKKTGSEIRAGW